MRIRSQCMLTQQSTIAASVTKLVIFYKIAVGKPCSSPCQSRKATNHGQHQESNSGDMDFTCMSVRKSNIDGIDLSGDKKTYLPPPCTGQWSNLRSGSLAPACLCFAPSSVKYTQSEAFEKSSPFHPVKSPWTMLGPLRMAAPVRLRLAPKSPYMLVETVPCKSLYSTSIEAIAGCNISTSGWYINRDQISVTKQTPEKVGDVGTRRNAVEAY